MNNTNLIAIQSVFGVTIFVVAIVSGLIPFLNHNKPKIFSSIFFRVGEALAAGVFLGAGLLHLIPDAQESFSNFPVFLTNSSAYPIVLFIAGISFLLFLGIEHVFSYLNMKKNTVHITGSGIKNLNGININIKNPKHNEDTCEKQEEHAKNNTVIAISAALALSLHSFFAGTALGSTSIVDGGVGSLVTIFVAIIAHKWAASFSLSITLNKSGLKRWQGIILFIIFSLMTPLGVMAGTVLNLSSVASGVAPAILLSISAGTFLYLGTLHGLEKSILAKECCDWKIFLFVILGFVIMAIIAIFT